VDECDLRRFDPPLWHHHDLLDALSKADSHLGTHLLFHDGTWDHSWYYPSLVSANSQLTKTGYHRLWSHTSYTATMPIQIFLALVGGGAIQGSIRWWSRNHRAHHRYTDTLKDPYSVQKGILYSHMGWMVFEQDKQKIGRVDISDLNNDPIVMWQHRHYVAVALSMAFGFPMLVAGLGWGDWMGGLVYAGIIRLFVVQQATFCVNSLAHWLGDQPFVSSASLIFWPQEPFADLNCSLQDDRNSPRDHVITALVTLGEGYHNFHHEFPADYRNAIEWHQYDPTKWCIYLWKCIGLASNLKTCRRNEIEKGRLQQLQKKLDQKRATINWGIPLEDLPIVDWDDYVERTKEGEALIAVGGVIHDVGGFVKEHPGGKTLIGSAIGKDATAIFNGGVYNHTNAAHNLLSTMRVGVLRGGVEVEVWKRRQISSKYSE
jgi:stearoyl-CoA desaturase (delta-9 desaturase)